MSTSLAFAPRVIVVTGESSAKRPSNGLACLTQRAAKDAGGEGCGDGRSPGDLLNSRGLGASFVVCPSITFACIRRATEACVIVVGSACAMIVLVDIVDATLWLEKRFSRSPALRSESSSSRPSSRSATTFPSGPIRYALARFRGGDNEARESGA